MLTYFPSFSAFCRFLISFTAQPMHSTCPQRSVL
jgi:hypothetical protein